MKRKKRKKKLRKHFLLGCIIFIVLLGTTVLISKKNATLFVNYAATKSNGNENKNKTLTTDETVETVDNNIKIDTTSMGESLKTNGVNGDESLGLQNNNEIIAYGNHFFEYSNYNIISKSDNTDSVDFKLEANDPDSFFGKEISLKIKKSSATPFKSVENMISYAQKNYNAYDSLKVYFNLTEDTGVTAYYEIQRDKKAYYFVFYGDKAYEIESSSSYTNLKISSSFDKPSYEQINEVISNQKTGAANLVKKYSFYKNSGIIEILQNAANLKFTAVIRLIEYNPELEGNYVIEVKNSTGETLISSTLYAGSDYDAFIKVLDLNGDGYMDLQILKSEGIRNNSYDLYLYDESIHNFIKVDIGDEILSTIEMKQGYICNWSADNDALGTVTYYVIEGNKLVKKDGVHIE